MQSWFQLGRLAILGLVAVLWFMATRHDEFTPRSARAAMFDDLTFGKSKPIEEVTEADVLDHPIWMWAVDEETVEGQDETWTKPITNTTDVSEDLIHYYPSLALKVVGTELIAFGDYSHPDRSIFGIMTWQDEQRVNLLDATGLDFPVILEVIATMRGQPGVRFLLEDPGGNGFAYRID